VPQVLFIIAGDEEIDVNVNECIGSDLHGCHALNISPVLSRVCFLIMMIHSD
jgi:hypothetical protein